MHMSFIHHVQIVGTGLLVWRSFEICTICTFWILCILLHRIIAGAHYAWICETGSSSAGLTGAQAEILSRVGKLPKSARDRCCFLTALSVEIKLSEKRNAKKGVKRNTKKWKKNGSRKETNWALVWKNIKKNKVKKSAGLTALSWQMQKKECMIKK